MSSGLRHVPFCLAVSGVVAAVGAVIGWWIRGGPGAAGALGGAAVMALAYLVSAVVIVWVDAIDRRLLLPIAMLTYILKIVMLGAVALAARRAEWSGLLPMAITAGAVIVLWPLAQLWHVLREDDPELNYQVSRDAPENPRQEPPQSDGAPRGRRSIA